MLLLTLPLLAAGLAATPNATETLREQIRQADTQLFAVAFEACDADKAAAMTTEDMEFFHDKDGKSASNREDFRRSVASLCDNARKGGWSLRRELVEPSLQVFPLHDERALEIGDHRFHERGKDGVERWVGQARFIQVWHRVDGRWLAERVISYDHRQATE
ncbi:nuclear transport factor 2 family protein [Stenotrophomonas maltophilia]|uniref:nuclear transport factor 2 family protein n=1 Tax=Stenotrophomonas maltophilia TaxID=40324 RepID=UPI0021C5C967|nr:nuclear transport factor 2 family protein [Stenotrophomonas maltophilia]MCU1128432.1 nuclear transport factor 2 family protein [Stenotrophomonas maltophilia]